MEHLVKFGTSSVVSYPVFSFFFGSKELVTDVVGTVSMPIALSVMAGASYLVSDLVHDQLFPAF